VLAFLISFLPDKLSDNLYSDRFQRILEICTVLDETHLEETTIFLPHMSTIILQLVQFAL